MRIKTGRPLSFSEYTAPPHSALAEGLPRRIDAISTSSREILPGDAFLALRGEKSDGHLYFEDAIAGGASLLIGERMPEDCACGLTVPDTRAYLGQLSAIYAASFPHRTVAVTGSAGKTTVKELTAAILGRFFRVHKTHANFNNELGVPLTLLTAAPCSEVIVLELGMNHAGELSVLSRLVSPDIAVITNVGSAHIGMLGSREAIFAAKLEIADGLKPRGVLLYPGDDPLFCRLPKRLYAVSVGRGSLCAYRITDEASDLDGCRFTLSTPSGARMRLFLPMIGEHFLTDAAFAAATADIMGVPHDGIASALADSSDIVERQKILSYGSLTVIDDCYNASPESMRAALDVLRRYGEERRMRTVAVLGDMLELGSFTAAAHRQVGMQASACDRLIAFGNYAKYYAEGATAGGMPAGHIRLCGATADVSAQLGEVIDEGDCILLKASHALHAELLLPELRKISEGE